MRRRRVVATVVGVLVLVVGAVVLLWPEQKKVALPPPPVSASPSPPPSPSPTPELPYPFFRPGECLDHPQLSKVITKPERRPCEAEHDGESISVVRLPEGLTDDGAIARSLRELCEPPLVEWEGRQGGGGPYYGYPVGPGLTHYQQGFREASCAMTVSNRQQGRKLTGHLVGLGPA